MKKTILRYGLISGGIAAVFLFGLNIIFKYIGFEKVGFDRSAILGYGTMIISMSLVYFGIRNFRDEHSGGKISFGKALLMGLGIMFISCILYALAWLVIYYNFIPTFMDDFIQLRIHKAQNDGLDAAGMAKLTQQMIELKKWYSNPFSIFAITLGEPMPVGILAALISALLLKRK